MAGHLSAPDPIAQGSNDMPFMVIYRHLDGSSGFQEATAIDEAALFVERLRNNESVEQIRLFRMEEITFNFRPYYKVELGLPERATADDPAVGRRVEPAGASGPDDHVEDAGSGPRPPTGTSAGRVNGANGSRLGLFQR